MPIVTESEPRGKRRHRWILPVLLLCVGPALVALALYTDPREEQALRTPGAILGVTRSDKPLVLGANWQKWLLRSWPQLKGRIGGHILRSTNTPPGS